MIQFLINMIIERLGECKCYFRFISILLRLKQFFNHRYIFHLYIILYFFLYLRGRQLYKQQFVTSVGIRDSLVVNPFKKSKTKGLSRNNIYKSYLFHSSAWNS